MYTYTTLSDVLAYTTDPVTNCGRHKKSTVTFKRTKIEMIPRKTIKLNN